MFGFDYLCTGSLVDKAFETGPHIGWKSNYSTQSIHDAVPHRTHPGLKAGIALNCDGPRAIFENGDPLAQPSPCHSGSGERPHKHRPG